MLQSGGKKARSIYAKGSKGARDKRPSNAKLQKQINALRKNANRNVEYLNLVQTVDNVNVTSPALSLGLSYFSGMSGTFGTTGDDFESSKIIHKSFGMDCYVTLENSVNNEESTIGFTAFLVSLRDEIGPYFLPGTGGLTLTAGITHESIKGMVLLNKKMFKIHKTKRFTLSNHDTALTAPSAQNQFGTDRRWYWRFSPNKTISNPYGNWKALNSANDPSKTYYFLLFTDNTSADLESPACSITAVHTMKTVA